MSRTHITKHAYEDMIEELYPNVRKQYKRRKYLAYVILFLSILFTLYIFTLDNMK